MLKTFRSFVPLILLCVVVSSISCGNSPQETTTDSIQPAQTKSDTEQVIDTVLDYIVAVGENELEWEYWYGGYDSYYAFKHDDESDINAHVISHLGSCYRMEDDGRAEYDFPEIQDNLAMFDVVLIQDMLDLGTVLRKSMFRFNLKKDLQNDWKITDVRLIYTENTLAQEYVSN